MTLPTPAATHTFGQRLGALLRAGDLLIVAGSLGAGKTALTQGIGAGMQIRGPITSPTFVIARHHLGATHDAPALLHVDAYRLSGAWELDDLDLDTDLTRSVVVVEWGQDRAEQLSEEYLLITLTRQPDDTRTVTVCAVGERPAEIIAELRTAYSFER